MKTLIALALLTLAALVYVHRESLADEWTHDWANIEIMQGHVAQP